MQFIDLHGHYAWDIDDGIPSKEEALAALEIASKNNIITIAATPHIIPGSHTREEIEHIKKRIEELKVLASTKHINVYAGCELFLNHDCIEAIHNDMFIPIEGTHYLLAEFDVRKELGSRDEVEDYLYEIEIKGYTPIVAHVERYFKDKLDLERIEEMIDNGYGIQINSSSLLGYHGKHAQKFAYELIDHGLVHVIASDTHRSTGKRIPCLQETFDILSKIYDYTTLKTLMYENPLHILHDEDVDSIEIKKSLFSKLFKRR